MGGDSWKEGAFLSCCGMHMRDVVGGRLVTEIQTPDQKFSKVLTLMKDGKFSNERTVLMAIVNLLGYMIGTHVL